jgi:hypothetical protein
VGCAEPFEVKSLVCQPSDGNCDESGGSQSPRCLGGPACLLCRRQRTHRFDRYNNLKFTVVLVVCNYVSAGKNVTAKVTFYGAKDNCPPGGSIAYPYLHSEAGGLGTYYDPITFAGTTTALPKHSIIYIPKFSKYFIFEDFCEECDVDWNSKEMYHFDAWMGPTHAATGIVECECQLSDDRDTTTVTLEPASNLLVDTTPFYDETRTVNQGCIETPQSCVDEGSKCGNTCQIPESASCADLADLFSLSYDRFVELNVNKRFKVNCSEIVQSGTKTCMGGTCGD